MSVEGEDVTQQEYEDEAGWRVVKRRGRANERITQHGAKDEATHFSSVNAANNKWSKEQRARQIMAASRMPSLPKEDYKISVRPRDGFKVTDYGINRLECCVANAAEIPRKETEEDTVCANYKQNILVVSTPSQERAEKYRAIARLRIGDKEFEANAYESAPEDTSKGVIRGVTHEVSPREIVEMLVTPRNPTVLMAKRMGNTTNVIILFDGHHVPNYVRYGTGQCGRLGHRADVCPNPNSRICRGCGTENPPQDHECEAKCQLCGKDHPTADRRCKARYKIPYLLKRRRWERARREEEEAMYYEKEAEALYRQGRHDWRQQPEHQARDRSRPDAFPKRQAREKGRSTSNNKTRSSSRSRSRSRSRSTSMSRPNTSTTGSPRPQEGAGSQSPKGTSSINGTAGPFKVSWADAASGARAEAQAALQNRIKALENELAHIRQSNVAFMDEIRKLRAENELLKSGRVTRNEETSRVVAEEKDAAMKDEAAVPIKRKTENAPIKTGIKKPKPAKTLPGGQEEFAKNIDAKVEQMETTFQTKLEQQEVRFEAKLEALGKTILQQVQQMVADFDAKLAIWGPQTSGGGPVKTSIKPYTRTPIPAEASENL
ncbi:hypothetical protein HPB52_007197 [Rhipicephalus sanguineus]|uniref:CCHC-type domain-containing protein n=1 Tax=Rhipicephalus sanguineus TaxID=34632 RepID=A0A9D4T7D0_RHISA|nr:hypothetical protein HPB52_007197 [Rhipicephalus sanguineus]